MAIRLTPPEHENMSKLLTRTRELLEAKSTNEMIQISVATDLPYSWLLAVRYKPAMNPAVDRVEKLYEYLSGHTLEVK